jgi:ABC-2 type transport system permease protein
MILLFNGMQGSLSMVYDRELGSMRVLLTSPMPRWFLLLSKLVSSTLLSLAQVYVFLLIALAYGIQLPPLGYLYVLPALLLSGLMLGGLGLLLSSMIRQLENFAGVMNFVIFPMFFTSSALYPLWKVEEASPILRDICGFNPFTYAVELIRFALYGQFEVFSAVVVAGCAVAFVGGAIFAYDPSKGIITRVRAGAAA